MQEEFKQEEIKFAVLIDADNVSNKYIKIILDEISNYGIATYKRIYGDWTDTHLSSWKPVLLDNSIIPIQQYSYTTGKNSTDSAMIIDAMDILYSGNVQGFCIVSSDSDFTRLVARLRESGMNVIGMGESKTPKAFIAACNQFKYLDILLANARKAEKKAASREAEPAREERAREEGREEMLPEAAAEREKAQAPAAEPAENETETAGSGKNRQAAKGAEKEVEKPRSQAKEKETKSRRRGASQPEAQPKAEAKAGGKTGAKREKEAEEKEPQILEIPEESAPQPRTNLEMVRQAIHSIIEDGSDEDGWMLSADLGNHLAKRFPDFDVRNFGFSKLTPFLASLKDVEIKKTHSAGNRSVLVYVRNR